MWTWLINNENICYSSLLWGNFPDPKCGRFSKILALEFVCSNLVSDQPQILWQILSPVFPSMTICLSCCTSHESGTSDEFWFRHWSWKMKRTSGVLLDPLLRTDPSLYQWGKFSWFVPSWTGWDYSCCCFQTRRTRESWWSDCWWLDSWCKCTHRWLRRWPSCTLRSRLVTSPSLEYCTRTLHCWAGCWRCWARSLIDPALLCNVSGRLHLICIFHEELKQNN